MRRSWLSALLVAGSLLACGPSTERASIQFALSGSSGTLSLLGGFQLTLLNDSIPIDCGLVEQTCLNRSAYYRANNVVPVTGPDGARHDAVFFPAQLSGSQTQELTIRDIPPGQSYAVVVEALSNATPPQFLGSFCGIQSRVGGGSNTPSFTATLNLLSSPLACDPTIP